MPRTLQLAAALLLPIAALTAYAAERVTLRSGFTIDCTHHTVQGDTDRLYTLAPNGTEDGYLDVPTASVVSIETIPDPPRLTTPLPNLPTTAAGAPSSHAGAPSFTATSQRVGSSADSPSPAELHQLLSAAGTVHNIDSELLAAVVHAESAGHAHAVSRAGARGLMQLMPGTAAALGVHDAFVAIENVEGGTRYLDQLLTRYHDDIALALAAYNAGPGAVDRYHGVPPYRETQAYVSRIIREFNRRKRTLLAAQGTLAPSR